MSAALKMRLDAIQKPARHGLRLVGGTALLLSAGMASAAPMDVTPVTTAITDQSSNIQTIALVVLGVLALIAGVSYLRRVIK